MGELTGITSEEARERQAQYGKNELTVAKKKSLFGKVIGIIAEPMFILLLVAATIYFILGEPVDGAIMLIFVVGIIMIEIIQELKTDKTLSKLKDLSAPHIKVIRDSEEKLILSSDLVPGDVMIIVEGVKVPADGFVLKCSDLCIDESTLTGEAEGVFKYEKDIAAENNDYWKKDYVYGGTLVLHGSGYIEVDKIGLQTEYGKIGKGVSEAESKPSPLQKQTGSLVKVCAGIAAVLFALVGFITYLNIPDHSTGDRIIESILAGVALAMAMIPEEFPVILTIFLSMGAWRLAKNQSLIRKMPAVETLGAVSVLCVDKTGTITKNQMTVAEVMPVFSDKARVNRIMGMACEMETYDPMEKAMLEHCEKEGLSKDSLFDGRLIAEYSFTNELKMMGHVWQTASETMVCIKGSPERVLELCELTLQQKEEINNLIISLSSKGLRVIAVGEMTLSSAGDSPDSITDCNITFDGLVGLYDPPRDTVRADIAECIKAKIRVVMITGDNGITACSIARQAGIQNCDEIIIGDQLNGMSDDELRECVKKVNIFSRVLPEHKMRIVKAFQSNGEIVAMTGDGVNDAAALKHADIGIAMGKRGSDVSREAADMILMDDNFSTIVNTVRDGRRIYQNIKKAVGYVFTIHIPIALASIVAPFLRILPANLMLLPLHIMLLELIVDPTCSIVLERQPAEKDIMEQKPRDKKERLLTAPLLIKSILQGLMIFAAAFCSYYFLLQSPGNSPETARTMAIAVIMLANLFLVQVNSSQNDYAFTNLKTLIKDKVMWVANIGTLVMLAIIIYTPLNSFLKLAPLSAVQILVALVLAAGSVLWYELVKCFKKKKHKKQAQM